MGGRGEGGVEGEGGVWAFAAGASEGRDGDYKGDALHSDRSETKYVGCLDSNSDDYVFTETWSGIKTLEAH